MPAPLTEVAHLTEEEVKGLRAGVNMVRRGKKCVIVHCAANGALRACENVCRHQGGSFAPDVEDATACIVKCTRHNWQLDVSTME